MNRLGRQLRAWLILGRVSNLPTVWTNILAAWILAGGSLAWSSPLGWLCLGGSLFYVGGTTLNDYFDAAFDREYRGERPIPSGVLSRTTVGMMAILYLLAGALVIGWGANGSWIYVACLGVAIVFYDYRHKEWAGSVFVMGTCRVFLSLLAASCATPGLSVPVCLHAAGLFAYIVALTFTARGESRSASPAGWPSLLFALPIIGALWVGPRPGMEVAVFIGLFGAVVIRALILLKSGDDPARIGRSVALMLAGISMLDAAFLAGHGWTAPLLASAGFVLALLGQKFVPAT